MQRWWLGRLTYAEPWHEELEDGERSDISEGGKGEDQHRVKRKVVGDEPGEDGSAGCSGCSAEPTTVLTLVEGNMSVGVEKRFADQP